MLSRSGALTAQAAPPPLAAASGTTVAASRCCRPAAALGQCRRQARAALHVAAAQRAAADKGAAAQSPAEQQPTTTAATPLASLLQRAAVGSAAALASAALLLSPTGSAMAANTAGVGKCLLQNCQSALAGCLADGQCAANLVCLNLCNGTENETACQIRCGDRYSDAAIDTFNSCVISEKKCVPQRVDKGVFPVPPDCALDSAFDLSAFTGRWYITAGLNPLFDTFPCQEHFFASPEPGTVYAKINWRIPTEDPLTGEADFLQRSTMQRFVQDPASPAQLANHGNEYLHYEDDWYVLASKPGEYVFIYYLGNNDAWKGYGGATVYTREKALPPEYIPELREAADRAGLDWSLFALTDNSCPAKPPARSLAQRLELGAERLEKEAEREAVLVVNEAETAVEDQLRSFGRGFTVLEQDLSNTLMADERVAVEKIKALSAEARREVEALEEEAREAARLIRRFEMEARMGPWVNLIPFGMREVIMPVK